MGVIRDVLLRRAAQRPSPEADVEVQLPSPSALAPQVKTNLEATPEVLRRSAMFLEQAERFLREGRALPLLILPERHGDTGCLSCGAPLKGRQWRCPICTLAVRLALDMKP